MRKRRLRRERREARREKQRGENVIRAREMHEARLLYGASGEKKGKRAEPPRFCVGCSGWYYWHWKGVFYPQELPGSRWFQHYASEFRTVELNAPFYSWPKPGTVRTWIRQAGRRRFYYSVKANELITHRKRFVRVKEMVRDFGLIADLLGPKMGCFLFQFPPSLHYSPAVLKRIVSQLEPGRRNVLEFRHKSWWNPNVYQACRKANAIFCSCSGPRLPDELVKTADELYIRFHGLKQWYRHDYSKQELAQWVDRIRKSGVKRIWAYFNNDRDGYAIKNAKEFLRQLKRMDRSSALESL